MPWELGGAILGATEPAGVGVGESERRGWCGFFSSRFQTAFLFFHTKTRFWNQTETRSITAAPFSAVLLECVLSAAHAAASRQPRLSR